MTQRLTLWLIVAVAALAALAASSASAASIYRGCDAQQWGTYPCWDPSNPADVAAMHPCPLWTDRHTPRFIQSTGVYVGFVKIRSTVNCKLADKLIYDGLGQGGIYLPAGGWYWWTGYDNVGGTWRQGVKELVRGRHIARTNWPTAQASDWNSSSTMLEHDLITYDEETLVDCGTVRNKALFHCVTVTPASYAGHL